jgi:hypothetical protein
MELNKGQNLNQLVAYQMEQDPYRLIQEPKDFFFYRISFFHPLSDFKYILQGRTVQSQILVQSIKSHLRECVTLYLLLGF